MSKALRAISLLLALSLVGVGCIGAFAQEPDGSGSEMIIQDNFTQEANEQEIVEQTGQETTGMETAETEIAEQTVKEAAETEIAEQTVREAAETEIAEQTVKEATETEIAEQAVKEAAETEIAEQAVKEAAETETAEQTVKEAAETEIAEQDAKEADEQESADQAAEEKKEILNEVPTDPVPSESEGTDIIEESSQEQHVAEALNEHGSQEPNSAATEELFTADISIELTNTGDLHFGDELQLKAVVGGANRSYENTWQNRDLPTPSNEEPEWEQIETGETYQLLLTEETAKREYRVLLIADNGETIASGEYRLPEPVRENEPAENETDTDLAPVEKDQQETEEPKAGHPQDVTAETGTQVNEEPVVISVDTDPDRDEAEDSDLELAQQEIVVVTEIRPAEETDAEDPGENGNGSGLSDQNDENPETSEKTDVEGLNQTDESSETSEESGLEGLNQTDGSPETSEKIGMEGLNQTDGNPETSEETDVDRLNQTDGSPETPEEIENEPESVDNTETGSDVSEENKPEKVRQVRVLSSLGETVVFGETVCMTVDLSDFEDCAEVSVIWEADKGSGWEEAGTGKEFTYIASADSINWNVRARVRYMP